MQANKRPGVVIVVDSLSALSNIKPGKSSRRQDNAYEIFHVLLRLHYRGIGCLVLWVLAHVRVEGNEAGDILAAQSLNGKLIDIQISLSISSG